MNEKYDAVIVGSGPNGLAAAIVLAQAKHSVLLIEANHYIGGSCTSANLTLPGCVHDICSAIHPLAIASPFFRSLPLEQHGLKWVQPPVPLAHPLDNGKCVLLHRTLTAQSKELGADGKAWLQKIGRFKIHGEKLLSEILQPLLHVPRYPLLVFQYGRTALQPAAAFARRAFATEEAQSLFAGLAAHSFLDLRKAASSATGLILAILAHAAGWPMPEGGAGKITTALASYFGSLGGKIMTNWRVQNIDELPRSKAIFLDLTPRQILKIARHRLPTRYCRKLEKYRYGPAAFKIDYALSAPVPWQNSRCCEAGTVHLGGTLSEITEAERRVALGQMPQRPFVLFVQPTLFDPNRAPKGFHMGWTYCHVPNGFDIDITHLIEAQIERFAPGFKDCVLARTIHDPRALEARNANLVGGDINGGLADIHQLLARPVLSLNPYRTPLKNVFICSAATPPGGGVHGMAGCNAAKSFLSQ